MESIEILYMNKSTNIAMVKVLHEKSYLGKGT